jgi:hypothetical protein
MAVAIQDTLKYGEPPDWFFPVRESLGAALLINGDAAGAEKVFRAQNKNYDAGFVEAQFRASWKGREVKIEDLA